MKKFIAIALAAFTFAAPAAIAGQLISDEQVGKTLAQIKCGQKPMNEALAYLNYMQVPVSKLNNPTAGVKRGYDREMFWKSC